MIPHRLGNFRDVLQDARNEPSEYGGFRYPEIASESDRWKGEVGGVQYDAFCGAMDTLLDAEGALVSFFQKAEKRSLIEVLGFLQVLYLQQDSVKILLNVLKYNEHPAPWGKGGKELGQNDDVRWVREIRNRVSGHTAYADRQDPPTSVMFDESSIYESSFCVTFYRPPGGPERSGQDCFSFEELHSRNDTGLSAIFCELLEYLKVDYSVSTTLK